MPTRICPCCPWPLLFVGLFLTFEASLIAAQVVDLNQSCTTSTGQNRFCAPWPPVDLLGSDFAGIVTVNASSSCSVNDTETLCYETKDGNGNVTCDMCAANNSASNLLSGGQWQSALQNSSDSEVIVEVGFGRLMLLFSIEMQFATTSTVALDIELSVSDDNENTEWTSIQDGNFTSLSTDMDRVELVLATTDDYTQAVQTNASLSTLREWEARRIRIVFKQSRNVNATATGPAVNEQQFFHYGLSSLTVNALCQCNGHAAACNLTGDGACACEHGTTGTECTTCAISVTGAAASPAAVNGGFDTCVVSTTVSSTVSTTPASGGSGGLSDAAIILIVLFTSIGVFLLFCIIVFKIRRKRAQKKAAVDAHFTPEEITVIDSSGLRSIVIKNKAAALDSSIADTSLMGEEKIKGR